jgi:pseudouridine-5'-phosphate glycosidase
MENLIPSTFQVLGDVAQAQEGGKPIVALESTVITHGLPHPENYRLALDMENEVREQGCVPATIALIYGRVHIGLAEVQLESLALDSNVHKISVRDFAPAIVNRWSGGTTVAGTLLAANQAKIQVFATGGIGGVHRQPSFDISADLPQLAKTPMIVVCAGAKAILDLPATLEYLETAAIPVIGYKTDEFPAFYSLSSGLPVSVRADSPGKIVSIAQTHWGLGLQSAVLVVQPPPVELAIPNDVVIGVIQQALDEAVERQIRGQDVTPFLLSRVSALTGGMSMKANLALLRNNARLAGQIAVELCAD